MATHDENDQAQHDDPELDVEAAQEQAAASPVTDDREPPAADEDRNP